MDASAICGDKCGCGNGMVGYGKGEDRRGGRAEMDKIGFTWDRRRERVLMPFSRIGEDLAHGAVRWTVSRRALVGGSHRDAKDGGSAVHAWVGQRGGSAGTKCGAGSDMFERGGDGVSAEDVEGVAGLF
jgi:hypothetical protein